MLLPHVFDRESEDQQDGAALAPLSYLVIPSRGIATRLRQPSPQEIQDTRLRLGLTLDEAGRLITHRPKPGQIWRRYEPDRQPRAMPLASWELFLLVTGQHLTHQMSLRSRFESANAWDFVDLGLDEILADF
ncbi:MAG TPA: hypothetical protein PLI96_01660 [Halothiobacillus sp.]|uniref:hypothetical protein n=1 Tax=Halothiobacillus sp. 15-55-196 TaxID=1970382 RepID=UPI0025C2C87C|nr:hypothetical protein [Halothiobacillus sp. 15-55-196]HUM99176.1 hypothetical protein [Halothiobacillus sp.]